MIVRMFKPQFAPLVESGTKRQTVRQIPKRMPKVGDAISLRAWEGKPYRSKHRVLRESKITKIEKITIVESSMHLSSLVFNCSTESADRFAIEDGFKSFAEMQQWFRDTHGLPFSGIAIFWE